jgi:hypothetical protein
LLPDRLRCLLFFLLLAYPRGRGWRGCGGLLTLFQVLLALLQQLLLALFSILI